MEQIKSRLEAREKQLLQLKKEKEIALLSAPEGFLRVCSSGKKKKAQFYHRTDPKDFNGVYIREKDAQLVQKLAQKEYDEKVLRAVEKELSAIHKFFSTYPQKCAEQVYEHLHKERQKLVAPIMEPDEMFVHMWESVSYQGKAFCKNAPEYYTAKGERVRSKSEIIIADALYREGIPYRYEYPMYLRGMGIVYPDFAVLNTRTRQEILWEHFGRMDDPEYAKKTVRKIESYEQNKIFPGEKLILTYETMSQPLNQKTIMRMIQRYLT